MVPCQRFSLRLGLRRLLQTLIVAVPLAGLPAAGALEAGSDGPWGVNYFPNVPLVTQDGDTVRFYDDLIRARVVAINFIYTSCADSCPMETARLREVAELLGERVGRDVFLYSISIDPKTDTPAVLRDYKARFRIDTPGWLFLTGNEADITLLRQKLGLYMPGLAGSTDHNLSLIVGNQSSGRWQKASPFENPWVLANHLGSVLHNWKSASIERNDYANAPTRLRPVSRGEQLFRTRCASCHVIGGDGGEASAIRAIGPDLLGVGDRRQRAWLARWLKHPERMIAEKDPIAIAMLDQYRIAMPNLRLSDAEVDALLAHIDEESVRLRPVKSPTPNGAGHEHPAPPAGGADGGASTFARSPATQAQAHEHHHGPDAPRPHGETADGAAREPEHHAH
jgi:protein SCO1/2